MSWGSPSWLHILWSAPILAVLLVLALRRRSQLMARLGALASERVSRRAQSVHRWRALLWLVGMVLGMVALGQPRWGFRWQELKREGLDIVVVLDVSTSMDAEDVSPTRMERARREVLDLTDLLVGDRVGLVVFAGGAYPRMPLTLDYGVMQHQVKDSASSTLVAQGSDIGAAIEMAAGLLGPRGAADQVILLISDGEDHVGEARSAAEAVAEAGIHLYTVGVGTPQGAPVPLPEGGFKTTRSGEVVMSRLDEGLLKDLARIGRGAYVRSGGSNRDIAAIYLEEIRGQLQGAEQGVRRERIWDERFAWPLAGAILAFLIGPLLRPGRLRLPGAAVALLWVAASSRPAMAQQAPSPADALAAEQAANPDDLSLAEALGMALLAEGRADEAHDVLSEVAERTLDPRQRTRTRYNAGHAALKSGHLTRAVEDWRRVTQDDPEHASAATNAQILEQEIARRLQQEPPSQEGEPQGGEPQDGEPQDGEPQDGEPQDGEPQDGEPPDGEPQGGEPQGGEPQDGEPQDAPPPDGEPQDGQPQGDPNELDGSRDPTGGGEEDSGLPKDMDDLRSAGDPADGDPSSDSDPVSPPSGSVDGEMTPEEAARTVDSVEEGRPQVVARPGAAGDKDW